MRHSTTAPLAPMAPRPIPLIESRTAPALPARMRSVCRGRERRCCSPSSAMLPETPATGAPSWSSSRYDSPPSRRERYRSARPPGADRHAAGDRHRRPSASTVTSHVPGASDRLPVKTPAASIRRRVCGAGGVGGVAADRHRGAGRHRSRVKVGVGAAISAAVSWSVDPGARRPGHGDGAGDRRIGRRLRECERGRRRASGSAPTSATTLTRRTNRLRVAVGHRVAGRRGG